MSTADNNTQLVLLGEYNLPNVIISSNEHSLVCNDAFSDQAEALINYFSYVGFYQHNTILNNANSQLDLVFSNDINTYVNHLHTSGLVPIDEYHPILKTSSIIKGILSTYNKNKCVLKDFKRANYELICKSFNLIDWNNLFSNKNFNSVVNIFYETQVSMRHHCKPQHPVWFIFGLIRAYALL